MKPWSSWVENLATSIDKVIGIPEEEIKKLQEAEKTTKDIWSWDFGQKEEKKNTSSSPTNDGDLSKENKLSSVQIENDGDFHFSKDEPITQTELAQKKRTEELSEKLKNLEEKK